MPSTPVTLSDRAPPSYVLDAAAQPSVQLPAGFNLFRMAFARVGDDLVLTAEDGRTILVRGYFGEDVAPAISDAAGRVLEGEIVAGLAEGTLSLSPEEMAALTGFVTEAGGGGGDDEFDVDLLQVTLADSDSQTDGNDGEDDYSLQVFGALDGAGADGGDVAGHSPVLLASDGPQAVFEVPFSPIVDLDSSQWSSLPGVRWQGLLPNDETVATIGYYNTLALRHVDRDAGGTEGRVFSPTGPERMLVVSVGGDAVASGVGVLAAEPAASIREINAFLGREETAEFGGGVDAVDGAVVRARVSVPADSTLLLDVVFDPVAGSFSDDFAFISVDQEVFRLLDAAATDGAPAGWVTVAVQNPEEGIVDFALGVVNVDDKTDEPYLAVDRVRIVDGLVSGEQGEQVDAGGDSLQVVEILSSASGSTTVVTILAWPLIAFPDAVTINETGSIDSDVNATVAGLLDNDQGPPSPTTVGGIDASATLTVIRVNGEAANVGRPITLFSDDGQAQGLLTVWSDGRWTYETQGAFDGLNLGEQAQVTFTYTAATDDGDVDTTDVSLTILGLGGEQTRADLASRIKSIDSGEWSNLSGVSWSALVPEAADNVAAFYQDAVYFTERDLHDGVVRRFEATDGDRLLQMASGFISPPGFGVAVDGSGVADLAVFAGAAGVGDFGLDVEPTDGSAIQARINMSAGSTLLIDALFDPPDYGIGNDFAFLTADGNTFRFAERDTTEDGTAGWTTLALSGAAGVHDVTIGVVNELDTLNDSYLAIDDVREVTTPAFGDAVEVVTVDGTDFPIVVVDGAEYQIVAEMTGASDPDIVLRVLAQPPVSTDVAVDLGESDVLSTADGSAANLLLSVTPPEPSQVLLDDEPGALDTSIVAINGLFADVGTDLALVSPDGDPWGHLTVNGDGSWRYDPGADLLALNDGETAEVTFTYTAGLSSGAVRTAEVTLTVQGVSGSDAIADFEDGALHGTTTGDVEQVSAYAGSGFSVLPAHGDGMARLDSSGTDVQSVRDVLGVDAGGSVDDPYDGSPAFRGSALAFEQSLEAGQTVSFYWSFDNGEHVFGTEPPIQTGANDFALFVAGDDVLRLIDSRGQYDQTHEQAGEVTGYWTQYTVSDDGDTLLGWAILDDQPAGETSTLLVDFVQVDAPVPDGYQVVDGLSDGPFATYAPVGDG